MPIQQLPSWAPTSQWGATPVPGQYQVDFPAMGVPQTYQFGGLGNIDQLFQNMASGGGGPYSKFANADYLKQAGYNPSEIMGYGRDVLSAIKGMPGIANELYRTSFDPRNVQRGIFSRNIMDRTREGLASSGLANSPYAQSIEGANRAQGDIAWGDAMLNRRLAGAQGMGSLLSQFGGLSQLGTGILADPARLAMQQGQLNIAGAGLNNQYLQNLLSYLQSGSQASQAQGQLQLDTSRANIDRLMASMRNANPYATALHGFPNVSGFNQNVRNP